MPTAPMPPIEGWAAIPAINGESGQFSVVHWHIHEDLPPINLEFPFDTVATCVEGGESHSLVGIK